ncbi:MAG: carboxymuconolactone decarboxylase family protein [Pseudomonadales bacterium]|jgi:4-carboxymuconolactone decarboxylase|nr:carboxymuconolactone decarboxylase family protein [Pseudomonadales bacterium]MDP7593993.1 carboxymuconolactone decarboxylase family protein [Pseudomonadales bacterium]HJN48851.1 carboxymuconolactone decarboxylase family protein [Pseudomonadales bacterium]|tara:strand:- start:280 stop:546 length:267 start_codon:yes stop_codon:yes gene_type:complete
MGTKTLSDRDREFVAVGAAIASNCVPCIEYHVPAARRARLDDAEIKEAVLLADKVKRVPARKVLETAKSLLGKDDASVALAEDEAEVS